MPLPLPTNKYPQQDSASALDWLGGLFPSDRKVWEPGKDIRNWLTGGSKPTESAPSSAPASSPVSNLAPFGLPTTSLRRTVPGVSPIEVNSPAPSWKPGSPGLLPPAPQLGQVPPMQYPGAPDISKVRSWMDTAEPKPPDSGSAGDANVSAVLGGLARGAGGVSATEPGSFAKALAMAGAGGASGREKSFEDFSKRQDTYEGRRQQYGEARASQEIQLAKQQQDYAIAKAQVDHQNASSIVETQFKNAQLQYEHNLKELGLQMPKVQNVPGGFLEEHTLPDGSVKRQFYDTRQNWEKLDGIGKTFAGLGMDPTVAQMQALRTMNLPPNLQTEMLKEMAVKEVIGKGMGGAAFGKYYEEAAKQVDAELQKDKAYTMLAASPTTAAKAMEMRQNYISSRLLQRFAQSGDSSWLQRIGDFSRVGAALTGRETPPEGP